MTDKAKDFLDRYTLNFRINRKFFELVPENKYDFRITPKSDSVKESIIHLICISDYILGVEVGKLQFKDRDKQEFAKISKQDLLDSPDREFETLKKVISDPKIDSKKVEAPWGEVYAVDSLDGLSNHEISAYRLEPCGNGLFRYSKV